MRTKEQIEREIRDLVELRQTNKIQWDEYSSRYAQLVSELNDTEEDKPLGFYGHGKNNSFDSSNDDLLVKGNLIVDGNIISKESIFAGNDVSGEKSVGKGIAREIYLEYINDKDKEDDNPTTTASNTYTGYYDNGMSLSIKGRVLFSTQDTLDTVRENLKVAFQELMQKSFETPIGREDYVDAVTDEDLASRCKDLIRLIDIYQSDE